MKGDVSMDNGFNSNKVVLDKDPYHSDSDSRLSGEENYGYRKPGAAITSMVLGICSVSLWWYPFLTSIPCIIMGIIAISMANKEQGRTDPKFHGFLKAGRITGIIGVIIASLYTLIILFVIIGAANSRY